MNKKKKAKDKVELQQYKLTANKNKQSLLGFCV